MFQHFYSVEKLWRCLLAMVEMITSELFSKMFRRFVAVTAMFKYYLDIFTAELELLPRRPNMGVTSDSEMYVD
jgi:hypothetical protein